MYFPKWVESPKSEDARASNRLRFILLMLALHVGPNSSLRALGEKTKINHTLLWKFMAAGSFSRTTAAKVIKASGTKIFTVEDLVFPLEITAEQ